MTSAELPAVASAAVRPAGVPREINAALARVRASNGAVVGSAFLVDSDRVVTCAHVVTSALGRRDQEQPGEDDTVQLEFPLVAPADAVQARVEVWCPVAPDDSGDIAVLSLVGPRPADLSPVRPIAADELWGHHFRTFGFPRKHDHGVWATGVLRGAQAAGWVQMDGSTSGYPVEAGFSGGAVWDDELAGIVGMTVAAEAQSDLRAAYLIPAGVLMQAWPVLAERAIAASPYRGLYPFRTQDAAVFFGREDLTARLVREVGRSPLVAVVGPSGSGKSSVVFAGLVPALMQEEGWLSASMRPSQASSPLHALAGALLPLLEPEQSETQRLVLTDPLAQLLKKGGLADAVTRILARARAAHLLLVVDQFEEVFTRPPEVIGQFVQALVSVLPLQQERRSRQLSIVLTMRADFLGEALRYPAMAAALESAVTTIGQMGRSQLRAVIEKPLPAGVRYEPGLVERILDDVGEEPGSLPLLEFALTLLWERQDRGLLTHAAYDQLGRVDGALATYAERVYRYELTPDEQGQARQLLGQLVRPTDVGLPVRRVARRAEMTDSQWELGQRLAATRLVVADRDPAGAESVELVHEALIGGWSRLHEWVDEDLAFRTWQEQLRIAMTGWEEVGRDPGALLRGAPLAVAERWLKDRREDLTEAEKHFIAASCTLRGQAVRRLRIAVASLTALFLIASVLGVLAKSASERSAEQARLATSHLLTNQATRLIDTELDKALLLSVAAHRVAATPEAATLVTRLASERRHVNAVVSTGIRSLQGVAFSSRDRNIALLWSQNEMVLWDVDQRRLVSRAPVDPAYGIGSAEFSPDGKAVAFQSRAGDEMSLWLPDEDRVQAISPTNMNEMGFSQNGELLGLCSATEHAIAVWAVNPLRLQATVMLPEATSCQVEFAADARLVFLDGYDLVTWDITGEREVTRDRVGQADESASGSTGPYALSVIPGGHMAIFQDEVARWWDIDRRMMLPGENVDIVGGSYSADGRWLFTGVLGVTVVDLAARQAVGGFPTWDFGSVFSNLDGSVVAYPAGGDNLMLVRVDEVFGMHIDGYGTAVAAQSTDQIKFFATPSRGELIVYTVGDPVARMVVAASGEPHHDYVFEVSDDGRLLATNNSHPNAVELMDLDSGEVSTLRDESASDSVLALAFDPTGRYLAWADASQITIWAVERGEELATISLTGPQAYSLALHPDGKRVAWTDVAQNAFLYDTATDSAVEDFPFTGAMSLKFSQDGTMLVIGTPTETFVWDSRSSPNDAQSIDAGHSAANVAFSPNGQYVAAYDTNEGVGVVEVWSLPDLEQVGSVIGDNDGEISIDFLFTPDSRQLVVGGFYSAYVVPFDVDWAMAHICSIVEEDLSREDWDEYATGVDYVPACD